MWGLLMFAFALAQSSPPAPDPLAWLAALGPFAVAGFVGWSWLRDKSKQCERQMQALEQQGPILVEIARVITQIEATMRASTDAMAAMSEALHNRIPSEAELTRLRDALTAAELRLRRRT